MIKRSDWQIVGRWLGKYLILNVIIVTNVAGIKHLIAVTIVQRLVEAEMEMMPETCVVAMMVLIMAVDTLAQLLQILLFE